VEITSTTVSGKSSREFLKEFAQTSFVCELESERMVVECEVLIELIDGFGNLSMIQCRKH